MLGAVRDRETQGPVAAETKAIVRYCYERGVSILSAAIFGNVIRLLQASGTQFDAGVVERFLPLARAEMASVFAAAGTSVSTAL